ncbi:hypothetical protein R70241_00043 [Paraburkholderia saeva]|nr:hypothetical protein R70241_00043 [Paraburkholderia saeva]
MSVQRVVARRGYPVMRVSFPAPVQIDLKFSATV